MKPSSTKKVFGIISYFPDEDTAYHIEMRRERSRRFKELLAKLEELWSDVDIMIIAQNWQDFQLPDIKNKITAFHYGKLGILGARKELRKRFLASQYDYLIMLDDDFIVVAEDPQAYMDEIDKHPNGFGALKRYPPSPLPFFAISKFIYNQIEMPDVDPEKGEGFEDDIFAATCFAKFPDASFIFPEGCVADKSFHYKGEGECPSTWSKEHKYNWDYMRSHTKSEISMIEKLVDNSAKPANDVIPSIDVIVTYVNGSDRNWIQDYIRTTKTHNPTAVRFRSWGTLKYLLRGIEKYMPFVRNVILVVARPSQVPVWINKENIRIVYHEDFIPKKCLPTFNSCTIESFLWNIPDLSERIIYFNDDMFPNAPMTEEDFFTDNKPHIKFVTSEYSERNIFRTQCRSGMDLIANALELPLFEAGKIIRPYHISSAFVRDDMIKVGELCQDALIQISSITRAGRNANQYIYQYYQYFRDNYVDEIVSYKYFELGDKTINGAISEILKGEYKMVCLNDSDKMRDFNRIRYQLISCFDKKFYSKSKYEL